MHMGGDFHKNYETVFEIISDAVIMINDSGKIVYVNSKFEELFGYQKDEVASLTIDNLITQTNPTQPVIPQKESPINLQNPTLKTELNMFMLRKDQTIFQASVNLSKIEFNNISRTVMIVHNLTAENDIKNQLQETLLVLN